MSDGPAADPAAVATAQRLCIFSLVVVLIAVGIDLSGAKLPAMGTLGTALDIGALALSIVGVILIGRALRSPLWLIALGCVAMFVGILNLIVLGWFNAKAMTVLRAAGWKVGFFGASAPEA